MKPTKFIVSLIGDDVLQQIIFPLYAVFLLQEFNHTLASPASWLKQVS
ncbi:hypothetical protein HHL23_22075 [Chryseobacterium sp. RP-3-3]|uniref:Uncharacterized protein n=1 Tax=Chryseobacterium antibioticum TaxID=2728847 RepID=A0A7Y0FTJ5_9FLAO|nr:hypothetical protein [Chryseobacterium antibioticum]NML72447.1 hypothetical protein [Chryseobacterium antibioticum]